MMKKKWQATCPICQGKMDVGARYSCKPCWLKKINNKPGALWQDKLWLEKQYIKNKLTFAEIAKIAECSPKTVEYFFKKFGLKSRPKPNGLKGEANANWKGGRVYDQGKYIRIFHPEPHPMQQNNKYVLEHILVIEKKLGHYVKKTEMVHHINGIKDDNRPENLELMTRKEHINLEWKINNFAKQAIFGDLLPHLKKELQSAFQEFLSSSIVNER